jgi:mono/diheme cytochrome c family protein
MKIWLWLIGWSLGICVYARAADLPPAPDGFALGGDAGKGQVVYKQYCAMCHGDSGKGDGVAAAALNPKPRNLSDAALMKKVSDWEVYLVIKEGGTVAGLSPMMVSWKAVLSDVQIRDVAVYVRSLAK